MEKYRQLRAPMTLLISVAGSNPAWGAIANNNEKQCRFSPARERKLVEKCGSRITPLVTIGLDADVGHHGVRYISPYRFLPALRPSIDGYPRRRDAADPLQHDVMDFETLLEGDLAEGFIDISPPPMPRIANPHY
jgi:hypothetical protein